ncbi:ADP-ribosylglycohydrolase family protein [Calothrix rhizosoleniae]|uniref:ADP-ribosylglycohydrolase family protein n=1 Tax=Calothrix rhizosoleniae TaxID=888997 RepID=UPI000B497EAA|nr:ADP-ribosylglycohydrolase family protein [Calothrix rhizosoleniae]
MNSKVLAGLMGLCIGDALGVPVEFSTREELAQCPVRGMNSQNYWKELPGTWSDDSSLTFCLAESLCQGFSLQAIADSFCCWYYEQKWTARGRVFDIGITTQMAIEKLHRGVAPLKSGDTVERSNGNGSLMRILPLAYYHKTLDFPVLLERVHQVSCITHAHPRSQMACGIYISIVIALLEDGNPKVAYQEGLDRIEPFYQRYPYSQELSHFERILSREIDALSIESINSEGYVIDTLEASLWCFLNTSSYEQAVLEAVNLGEDTDTTAAVTGGLAGIYYGLESIPIEWINTIARKEDIIALANHLEIAIY